MSPEPELMEEKDVEEDVGVDVEEGWSIVGSVDWREREVDTVDCDAGGVSTPVGVVSWSTEGVLSSVWSCPFPSSSVATDSEIS